MLTKTRRRIKTRIKGKITGTAARPRLSVFRSNKVVYAQLINDEKGHTVASARDPNPQKVGEEIAAHAKKAKVKAVVFDRGGYQYHGKVKILADAAREGGLKF